MKIKNVLSIIFNLILGGACGYAVYGIIAGMVQGGTELTSALLYIPYMFTFLSNTLLAIICLWGVVRSIINLARGDDKPSKLYSFTKLGITTAMILIAVTCVVFLRDSAYGHYVLWILHVGTPAAALLIYLFIDSDHRAPWGYAFSSIILPVVFFGYSILLNILKVEPWTTWAYPFLNVLDTTNQFSNIITLGILFFGTLATACLLYLINYGLHRAIYSKLDPIEEVAEALPEVSEPTEEEKPLAEETVVVAETPKTTKKSATKKTNKKVSEPVKEEKTTETKQTNKKSTSKKANKTETKEEVKEETKPAKKAMKKETAQKAEEKPTKKTTNKNTSKTEEKPAETKPAAKKASSKKENVTAKTETKITAKKTTKATAKPTEEKPVETASKPEYRVYHVSKRADDGKWQVKFAKGERAIKLFRTQAEAIEFAKKLAESQNGSIRVHSVKGKIRKV